jgi:hypothetical protein
VTADTAVQAVAQLSSVTADTAPETEEAKPAAKAARRYRITKRPGAETAKETEQCQTKPKRWKLLLRKRLGRKK